MELDGGAGGAVDQLAVLYDGAAALVFVFDGVVRTLFQEGELAGAAGALLRAAPWVCHGLHALRGYYDGALVARHHTGWRSALALAAQNYVGLLVPYALVAALGHMALGADAAGCGGAARVLDVLLVPRPGGACGTVSHYYASSAANFTALCALHPHVAGGRRALGAVAALFVLDTARMVAHVLRGGGAGAYYRGASTGTAVYALGAAVAGAAPRLRAAAAQCPPFLGDAALALVLAAAGACIARCAAGGGGPAATAAGAALGQLAYMVAAGATLALFAGGMVRAPDVFAGPAPAAYARLRGHLPAVAGMTAVVHRKGLAGHQFGPFSLTLMLLYCAGVASEALLFGVLLHASWGPVVAAARGHLLALGAGGCDRPADDDPSE